LHRPSRSRRPPVDRLGSRANGTTAFLLPALSHPCLQGNFGAGPGPGARLPLRGNHLSLPVRGGQGHHRLALQRLSLLPPFAQRSRLMTPLCNHVPAPKTVRCAIYTRKSSEEGLEQEFNSLDAQREAAEAYLASQQHQGWIGLPERYDDGGYSGGTLNRPALKRLPADNTTGTIDAGLVCKLHRPSRSPLDFSPILGIFEKHQVAFVSITQQFHTATSMGRLVLNLLLSFAQFERELIAERTRDKIAAARRKGKWVGGMPLLGYDIDPKGSKLRINNAEA